MFRSERMKNLFDSMIPSSSISTDIDIRLGTFNATMRKENERDINDKRVLLFLLQ
jgi:hypothetical protein